MSIVTADSDEGRHILRHSTAHVLAQAVTRLFPGAKYTIGPAIENGFYYDFDVPGGRTFTDEDLAAIDAEMRKIIAEDQPFVRSEVRRRRGDAGVRRPAVQARDHRTGRRRPGRCLRRGRGGRRRRRQPLPELAGVRRPLPRAARAVDGPPRPLQAAEGVGRLLARRREAPDAPARLRHGVGERQGAQGAPAPAGGSREARPSQAGRRAGPAQLPRGAGRRPGRVAPEGRHRAQADGGLQPRPPPAGRLPVRVHAAPLEGPPVRDERPPRLVRRQHVPADGDGQRRVLPEAHELPDALPHLPVEAAQLPRAAAAALRAGHGLPLRAGRHAARAHAHPRLHAGRQPHLLHAGAGRRRDPRVAPLRAVGAAGVRLRGVRGAPVDA